MPVFVVGIHGNLKGSGLYASAKAGRFGLSILLRKHGGDVEFAKLQLSLDTKQ